MLTAFRGGNPPTHPPATWFRSIFDPAANTLPSAYPAQRNISSSSQHLHSYVAGRLYPEKQQLVFPAFCSPCTTPACIQKGAPPESQAGHAVRIWATTLGSSLPAGAGKGCTMPFVHTCAAPLWWGVTHTRRTGLAHQHLVRRRKHRPGISPGGTSPMAKPRFSTETQPALVEKNHLYTAAFQSTHILGKKPKGFPPFIIPKQQYPSLLQPSQATRDLSTQPAWQAFKSKIPPRPLPLPKGEFPQAAPHTCRVTSPASTDKAKINR